MFFIDKTSNKNNMQSIENKISTRIKKCGRKKHRHRQKQEAEKHQFKIDFEQNN